MIDTYLNMGEKFQVTAAINERTWAWGISSSTKKRP